MVFPPLFFLFTYSLLLDTAGDNLASSGVNGDGARGENEAIGNDSLG